MKILLFSLALVMTSASAKAETWIARCNNLQFNFDKNGKVALIYFKTSTGIYQMAKGDIGFDNGVALRASVDGNSAGFGGQSLTEIGLNKSRNLVYVQYRHPTTGAVTAGDFCSTPIQIVP
jgi:hypothetical protein